ncbi:hypothetical protein [Streptomyces sp. NPDC058695]|uniref:hypothetical protein n=1 Tax=Streptomyces sp. NPDC058695 TaxID=3346604 RepID=UPI003668BC8F
MNSLTPTTSRDGEPVAVHRLERRPPGRTTRWAGAPAWWSPAAPSTSRTTPQGGNASDPDEECRGWEFWDVVQVGPAEVRVWVDSWGESFFGSLDLLWVLYTAGAARVEGPTVQGPDVWAAEVSGR